MAEIPLIQISGTTTSSRVHPVVLAKGFRPFFLLAGLYAALSMLLWLCVLEGRIQAGSYFGGIYWHAHEMIFGFTLAVIGGFLLTAVGNWTNRETVVGPPLAGLAALWLVGRLAVLFAADLPGPLVAVLDLSFLPALTIGCLRPILAIRNQRNYQFVVMLTALFLANLGMHLGALGIAPGWIRRGAWVAVDIIILMIIVMTARVLPMFTRNATGVEIIRNLPRLDYLATGGAAALVLCDATAIDERFCAIVALLAGLAVAARSATWGTRHTARYPLLWVLHGGHAFVALGLILRGIPFFIPQFTPSAALHALTAGGIGMLTLGMMARVSLGHSGRLMAVGRPMTISFGLLAAAAVIRVFGPLAGPSAYLHVMLTAGILFTAAFVIFLVVYVPILLAPRVDGRAG